MLTVNITSDELSLAMRHGYRLASIMDCQLYKKEQKPGLFSDFISSLYLLKQQNSPLPDVDLDRFVQEFFERHGQRLDPSDCAYRPSYRQCAKLLLKFDRGVVVAQ